MSILTSIAGKLFSNGKQVAVDGTGGSIPIGGAIPYFGLIANIPSDWELVTEIDGKMFLGTTVEGEIGDTGGSNDAVNISHSHTSSSSTAGDHIHPMRSSTASDPSGTINYGRGLGNDQGTYYSDSAGDHSHAITVNSSGVAGTDLNLPAYVKCLWIRRIA